MSRTLVAEFARDWPERARTLPRWALRVRPPVAGLLRLLELAQIAQARTDGDRWYAEVCPACRASSLWIRDGHGGVVLWCWSACNADEILEALEHAAAVRA